MQPALELCWEFTPRDLFEEPFLIQHLGCEIALDLGSATATIPKLGLSEDEDLRPRVERFVTGLFLGAMLQDHTLYELSRPRVTTLNADGSRGLVIDCEPGHVRFRGLRADILYTNEKGEVVDTRRERIAHKQRLGKLAAHLTASDETLSRMLRSYNAAVRDPVDELIHPAALEFVERDPFELEIPVAQHARDPRPHVLRPLLARGVSVGAELQIDPPDVVRLLV